MEENFNEKRDQQSPNGLEQDETITTAFDVGAFERSVLSDTLKEAAKEQGIEDYSFTEEVLEDFQDKIFDTRYNISRFFDDFLTHGCVSGFIESVIYYNDTKAFYLKHFDDIEEYVSELEEDIGEPLKLEPPRYNSVTWLIYEELAGRISEDVAPTYCQRLKDSLADLPTNLVKVVAEDCDLEETEEVATQELDRREKLSASQKQEQQPTKKRRGGMKL